VRCNVSQLDASLPAVVTYEEDTDDRGEGDLGGPEVNVQDDDGGDGRICCHRHTDVDVESCHRRTDQVCNK